ncbi:hypothetical protein I4U23_007919 [Adineta vaga]|nr:hypothetical protein I4U23_007919 [Adineta vaga]
MEDMLDNLTSSDDLSYTVHSDETIIGPSSAFLFISKILLRLTCVCVLLLCPWMNFKLIQFFQTRIFYKDSSVKWYIIFKAVFDTLYILISIPIIFSLTFTIDIVHKNFITCKLITYLHYLTDDLISMMLTLACIDRMIRITCGTRLRTRFSLIVCIVVTCLFMILNIHHFIRLKHVDGFCHKTYFGIWDYDFDIYYSLVYTSISWFIIFISLINLTTSIYCDRARRLKMKQQQQQQQGIGKVFLQNGYPIGSDSDRLELIRSAEDCEESIAITIQTNNIDHESMEQVQQDNIDLQVSVGILITSAIFLLCNLPNFIIFVMRFVFHSTFATIGYIFIYVALFPLLIAHTISYFVFNHLLARIFRNNSSSSLST